MGLVLASLTISLRWSRVYHRWPCSADGCRTRQERIPLGSLVEGPCEPGGGGVFLEQSRRLGAGAEAATP